MNAPATVAAEQYLRIPLDQLQESKTNPRRHFNKVRDTELAASIRSVGVIEPIIVRPQPNAKGYEIVAGARRFRQSKVAGAADIPAVVRQYTDVQIRAVQLIENLQRDDIHPYDEAFGFRALLDLRENGKSLYDVPTIAAKIGKSPSYVYMRLKLTDLIQEAQEAFLNDKITAGHAEKIARLQPKDQKEALKQCLDKYRPASVRGLAEWIDENVHLDLAHAPFKPDDATLVPSAKACTTCPKRTGAQPDLFPDITKGDVCTDRACFKAKVNAHTQRVMDETKAAGKKIVKISTRYNAPAGVLGESDWKPAPKACPSAKLGLIVDAHRGDKDQVGTSKPICDNKKCKLHWQRPPSYSHSSAPKKSAAQQGAEKQKRDAKELTTATAIALILKAFDKKPTLAVHDLQMACMAFVNNVYGAGAASLAKHHGLKNEAAIEPAVTKCKTVPEITRWFFGLVLLDTLDNAKADDFEAMARRRGVDVAKLRKTTLAELQAKKKALAIATRQAKTNKAKLATLRERYTFGPDVQTLAQATAAIANAKPAATKKPMVSPNSILGKVLAHRRKKVKKNKTVKRKLHTSAKPKKKAKPARTQKAKRTQAKKTK